MAEGAAGPLIGVVALQGAVGEHVAAFQNIGARTVEVRTPADLNGVDAVTLPGGESTTMSRLLGTSGLFDALSDRLAAGMPAFGTCAGMILLAAEVLDGRSDQRCFGAIDISVRRNAFGRQVASFEADLATECFNAPFHAVFIRAPWVERAGAEVEVLAAVRPTISPAAASPDDLGITAVNPATRASETVASETVASETVTPETVTSGTVTSRPARSATVTDDAAPLVPVSPVPVLCRSGSVLVSSFHPELTADDRIHRLFIDMID